MTVLATDTFNRADNVSLGANWSSVVSMVSGCRILSNQVTSNSASGSGSRYTGVSFPADQYSQAVIGVALPGGGPTVRADSSGNFYLFTIDSPGVSATALMLKYTGSFSTLDTRSCSAVVGDVIRLEVSGTTLTGKVNGTVVSTVTDTAIASGNPGLHIYFFNPALSLDDWEGGDLAAAPTGRANLLTLLGVA
jgi:hypothetical protein